MNTPGLPTFQRCFRSPFDGELARKMSHTLCLTADLAPLQLFDPMR